MTSKRYTPEQWLTMTDEERDKKAKELEAFDAMLKANGLEHWWD